MISNTQITAQPEYDIQFWNAMRNKEAREDILAKGRDISTGTYSMPTVAAGKVMNGIEKESDFRKRQLFVHTKMATKSLQRTARIRRNL